MRRVFPRPHESSDRTTARSRIGLGVAIGERASDRLVQRSSELARGAHYVGTITVYDCSTPSVRGMFHSTSIRSSGSSTWTSANSASDVIVPSHLSRVILARERGAERRIDLSESLIGNSTLARRLRHVT